MKMRKLGVMHGLAVLFGAILLAFYLWQNPGVTGHKLSADEVDRYLAEFDRTTPLTAGEKVEALDRLRTWAEADDGRPVYMLNLMRFYPAVRPMAGGPGRAISPALSNAHYEAGAMHLLVEKGGAPLFAGNGQGGNVLPYAGNEDHWSRMLVIRYPDRRAFLELVTDPRYTELMPYKLAALELILAPFEPEMVLPDPTLALGTILLILFLAIGWWRAARRVTAAQ